ncbi:MAG: lysine--tRNA ligase [Anaerolineae bacterium]|nr:lysine--tRNA ligase [Anaerolineae bacterium]
MSGGKNSVWQPDNNVEKERLEKLERIREKGIEPYPTRAERTHTIEQAMAAYVNIEAATPEGQEPEKISVAICGRIVRISSQGKSSWAHIEDGTGRIQLWIKRDKVGEENQSLFDDDLDLFDFVQAKGTMMRTRRGEVTVLVDSLALLSKSLSPLPVIKERRLEDGTVERYGGFKDPEERYRQRYADLAVNPDVRQTFITRARVVSAIRRFLDQDGFLEVETPILHPIYGGAAARPFMTHHNQLKQDLYLRISFELYLKRLLVGMYDAVYEIGRDFRNEGVDRTHNPEFTQVEFYKAYSDYVDVMDITERLVAYVAQEVTGGATVTFQGHTINFAPPWQRITLRDAIIQYAGIDYVEHPDAESLKAVMVKKGKHPDPASTWGKLVDSLLGTDVEPNLIQPTFVLDYPRDISPLAKKKPDDPTHVERFEFFIAGVEMGNAFTELNDPLDQEQRFLEMGRLYGDDSEESHPVDEDYLRAMRYGMPPCGGWGMGVDRMVMLLSDCPNIREVLLFPHLRERDR